MAHSWSDSFIQMGFFDGAEHLSGVIKIRCASGQLADARNTIAAELLKREDEWLLFLDTDMGFRPDTMARLLEVADRRKRPIVGGLCFVQKEVTSDGMGGYTCRARPTIMDWCQTDQEHEGKKVEAFMGRSWYAPNALTRCGATGMACALVHRSVLERVREKFGEHWFDRVPGDDGKLMGEDIAFCMRCGVLDIPIYVHTGIRTTHCKNVWLGEADFWMEQIAPPATQRTLVIVPVLHRPANAEPLWRSLRASTGLADLVAVADEDDVLTIAAWQELGVDVLKGSEHTFAEKVNRAYRERGSAYDSLFLCGDDVAFYPGWLDQAQWCGHNAEAAVVGTNDLGNPRVMSGEHGTHLLIARDYIDEIGAGWDGPKTLAHEGYRHWYVDDEIVTAAKQRNVWVSALGSLVEHLHPLWEKGAMDATYEEGNESQQADEALFRARFREHAGARRAR